MVRSKLRESRRATNSVFLLNDMKLLRDGLIELNETELSEISFGTLLETIGKIENAILHGFYQRNTPRQITLCISGPILCHVCGQMLYSGLAWGAI